MEDPDSEAQLPLPSLAPKSGAQIIKLPARTKAVFKNELGSSGNNHRSARLADKQPGPNSLWYALYLPQLINLNPPLQEKYLNQLAGLMQNVSSTVSFHPQALICEIRSSLKYFTGIDVIHQRLQRLIEKQLQHWGLSDSFLYAASPTVSGSLLLAKAGINALVYQKANLRSALGQLSTDVLDLDKEQQRRLHNMGVRNLRDIWRLPSDGLCKRFGSNLVDQLNKAIGKVPEPTRNYIPPPIFSTSCELPCELENLGRLLPIADEMLGQLCDFLRRRDLSTSHLLFSLLHEKQNCTEIHIGLRQASRSQQRLMLLLETHFDKLSIPAPVIAIKIEVKKFDAFFGNSNSLLDANDSDIAHFNSGNLILFMEKLQARLGENHVKNVINIAQHCPEHASMQFDYRENFKQRPEKNNEDDIPGNPRPLWLLQDPIQLSINKGRLFHRKAISIISGPERLETHWWSGADVRRDYYTAKEANGSRLWIYREKSGEKKWYLHGFFA